MDKKSYKYVVSIIILNWNGLDNTIECLKSLEKVKDINFNIIVIDNGSVNDESSVLQKIFGKSIEAHRLEHNTGFTGGVNYGLEIATKKYAPDYYLLLNNDTIVDKDFLKFLIQTATSDNKIGMVGSILYDYYHKNKINYSGGGINWLLAKHYRNTKPISSPQETHLITGCSMLIKKEVLKKIGLLDDIFFAYFEDSVLCLKTQKAGYLLICDPRSIVYHKEQGSTGHKSKTYTYLMSRNRILYVNKYTPFFYRIYFFFFILTKLLAVQLFFLATRQTARASAFLRGYVDGMKGKTGKPPQL